MIIIIAFAFLWLWILAGKALFRAARRWARSRPRGRAPAGQRSSGPAFSPAATIAALDALQQQRDGLRDQLELIKYALDGAPPENKRLQLMQRQTMIYSRLAQCETKIGKLTTGK